MSLSNFISRKIVKNKENRFSKPIVTISVCSVALGVCVLILVFAITTGFRKEIRDKIIGFGSHVEISYNDNNESYKKTPIDKEPAYLSAITALNNVKHIQVYAMKAGIVKVRNEIDGIVLKGVGVGYDLEFFQKNLKKGRLLNLNDSLTSNEVLISQTIANRLHLDIGSKMQLYFVQDPPRQRVLKVVGIYQTDMANYDKSIAFCDIKHIQKLNDWTDSQIDGFEITLKDFNQLEVSTHAINAIIPYDLIAQSVVSRNKDIFNWIGLFDQNILVILILIIIVICISLMSTQLTMILEQIPTIGILKTIGCNNVSIRNVFLNITGNILLKGMLIGNGVGLLLCYIQYTYHLIALDPLNYYMSNVPISVEWQHLLLVNGVVFSISLFVLLFPAYFVARKIQIVDAIRFN